MSANRGRHRVVNAIIHRCSAKLGASSCQHRESDGRNHNHCREKKKRIPSARKHDSDGTAAATMVKFTRSGDSRRYGAVDLVRLSDREPDKPIARTVSYSALQTEQGGRHGMGGADRV